MTFQFIRQFFAWILSRILSFFHAINPFPTEKIIRKQQIRKEYDKLTREKGNEKRYRDYATSSKIWKQHMTRPVPRKRRA